MIGDTMTPTSPSPNDTYTSPLAERNASKEMLQLWSPRHKFNTWRRIWLAVAEAQHELGLPVSNEQVPFASPGVPACATGPFGPVQLPYVAVETHQLPTLSLSVVLRFDGSSWMDRPVVLLGHERSSS